MITSNRPCYLCRTKRTGDRIELELLTGPTVENQMICIPCANSKRFVYVDKNGSLKINRPPTIGESSFLQDALR